MKSCLCRSFFLVCALSYLFLAILLITNGDKFAAVSTKVVRRFSHCARVPCHPHLLRAKHNNQSALGGKGGNKDIENLVWNCMRATHMDGVTSQSRQSLLQQAKKNARYMYEEYRRVIPAPSLDGYRSHCWRDAFSAQWNNTHYSGHTRQTRVNRQDINALFTRKKYSLPVLDRTFPSHKFSSSLMCLPNVFVPGFQKCGTTYLYHFLHKLFLAAAQQEDQLNAVTKEPRFWVRRNPILELGVPKKSDLVGYLLNYTPGIRQIAEYDKKDAILLDGSHNVLFNWPRFRSSEDDVTNYCLLPSVLPRLLPASKFLVIMRNPIDMLYSAFWYSCTVSTKLSSTVQLRGPETFHHHVLYKISQFTRCMRDSSNTSLSHACKLDVNYSSCIVQRLHLLDNCTHQLHMAKDTTATPSGFQRCGKFSMCIALYYVHIRKWLSVVPRNRFHFLTLEDLLHDTGKASHDILGFLGLDTAIAVNRSRIEDLAHSSPTNSQTSINYKDNAALRMRGETRELLQLFYQPFNTLLAHLIRKKLPWGDT